MDFQDLVKFALICFDSLAWPLFALGYPLRASIQAVVNNSETDTKKLVTYWIIFSLVSLFEHAFMGILQWLPFWPYMKLMIVGWTMIPRFDGAFYIYNHFVHPCLYMEFPTIVNWFKKLQELYLNNFLAEAADEHVEAHKPPEALENLIANEPKGTEPSILQENVKPVRVAEKIEVAPVKQIPATEPIADQTVNDAVTPPEIDRVAGFDLLKIPSDEPVQKEWTCAMCQVKVTCEKTLNSHLRGKKHRNLWLRLTNAKNQPCKGKVGSVSAVKEPWKECSSSNIQGKQQADAVLNWARYFAGCRTLNANPQPRGVEDIMWQRPPQGWCCLNTNGAVAPTTGMGIVGGVIRDCDGRWLLGFCKSVGVTNVLQAELWGLYEGLQIASAYNFEYLVIQIDNVQVAQLVDDKEAGSSSLPLVRAIFMLRQRCLMTKIQWIRREANTVADRMTKLADSQHHQTTIYGVAPKEVQSLVERDISSPYCRTALF